MKSVPVVSLVAILISLLAAGCAHRALPEPAHRGLEGLVIPGPPADANPTPARAP